VLAARPLDGYTALAAVTHDPKIDDFALKAALDAGCFYVGALGSRKTHAKRVERLLAAGATADEIARIHAPIGLDIGAASPAEIAVAVLAQVIKAFRSRGAATDAKDEAA
jgi:xanthine dehydrogenase accessory factor